jgi:hypothetical protein
MADQKISSTTGVLNILGAAYGLGVVTNVVSAQVDRTKNPQTATFVASNDLFGDTWPTMAKMLTVFYQYDGEEPYVVCGQEGTTFAIRPQGSSQIGVDDNADHAVVIKLADAVGAEDVNEGISDSPALTLFGATWAQDVVTSTLLGKIKSQALNFVPDNDLFKVDPWPGIRKTCVLLASYPGQVPFTDIVIEDTPYSLAYSPPLEILAAYWGGVDVQGTVRASVSRRSLDIMPSNDLFGFDPLPGSSKTLTVIYQYGDRAPQMAICQEGNALAIGYDPATEGFSQPRNPAVLSILSASYGTLDVKGIVTGLVTANSLSLTPTNDLFKTDPIPGSTKIFTVAYAFGPSEIFTAVCAEGQPLQIAAPVPLTRGALTPLTGLYGVGVMLKLQTGTGTNICVENNLLTADPAAAAPTAFTVGLNPQDSSQLTLQVPGGGYVVVDSEGRLAIATGSTPAPAYVIPALASDGAFTLSVIPTESGASPGFVAIAEDGTLTAMGSFSYNMSTAFNIQAQLTQASREHLLGRLAAADVSVPPYDPLLAKVIWDLSGGLFLAIGLGPLITRQDVGPGLWALLMGNVSVEEKLLEAAAFAVANPGKTTAIITAFIGVLTEIWNQGLLWQVLDLCWEMGKPLAMALALTTVLKATILPAAGAAEILVGFAGWAYTTTMDCIAYANSQHGSLALADYLKVHTAVTVQAVPEIA